MHAKNVVLATILALLAGSSAAGGADIQRLERVLDQWAAAWSSSDVDTVLALFTDDVLYEDVTFGSVKSRTQAASRLRKRNLRSLCRPEI